MSGWRTGVRMGPVLLSWALVVFWVSEAPAEILLQPEFDAQNVRGLLLFQFSGLWYVVAMVSDCKDFLDNKDYMLMSTRTVNASMDGDLSVHMEFPRADGCNQDEAEYLRVGSQGHFRVPALHYLDVRISDTDYSSFAVVYIFKELEGVHSTMVQLYSRTQDPSPQALKAFRDFYPTLGLLDNMTVVLPKSDACSPEQGGTQASPVTSASTFRLSTEVGLEGSGILMQAGSWGDPPTKPRQKAAKFLLRLIANKFDRTTNSR